MRIRIAAQSSASSESVQSNRNELAVPAAVFMAV